MFGNSFCIHISWISAYINLVKRSVNSDFTFSVEKNTTKSTKRNEGEKVEKVMRVSNA